MRFLVDMDISPQAATALQEWGHDAVHLQDQHLNRLPDPEVFKKAQQENRILVTHDLGFGGLLAASKARLPSVIIFRLHDMRPDRVNHYLEIIIKRYGDELQKGVVISVTERQIRIRALPTSEE